MQTFIEYSVLDRVLRNIRKFEETNDFSYLEPIQDEIKLASYIDYSIKTPKEYKLKCDFIEDSHGPARMGVFVLSYYGEFYCNQGLLTIKKDDPSHQNNSHTNTYRLVLKDIETHTRLYTGNPTYEDDPYDFNTIFISQITEYPNGPANTTTHSWDSFQRCYTEPYRRLDFKSALWQSGGEHSVHYILQLPQFGPLECLKGQSHEHKEIEFKPAANTKDYYINYLATLDLIKFFKSHNCDSWDRYLIKKDQLLTV